MGNSLTALSPFGPIFGKELRTTSRRKRTYWLRFLYLLALFIVMLLAYTSTAYRQYGTPSVAERAQEEAELGNAFFISFSMFSVIALLLIAPVLTATAIGAERLARTLNVLLMTPITSWQIVSGKLFSRLLAAMMLLALSLPVLAVVRLLGGVELDRMLTVLGVCVAATLFAAAIGLFYSTFMNRAYAVILLAYVTMLFLYAFLPFVLGMGVSTMGPRRGPPVWFFNFLTTSNPVMSVIVTVAPRGFPGGGRFGAWPCIATHLAMTGLLVAWSAAVLRRLARKEGEPAIAPAALPPQMPSLPDVASPASDAGPSPVLLYATPTRSGRAAKPPREVGDNPVFWREVRRPLFPKRWQRWVGSIACVALLLVTYAVLASGYRNELAQVDTHIGYAFVFCGLLTLLVCVLAATSIAAEKESDTWTLLLATPLSGRDILLGKVGGVLRRLTWPFILIAAHFLLFAVCGVIAWTACLLTLWVMVTFNVVWLASGVYLSLRVRNNTFAIILNLLLPVLLLIAVPVILLIVGNVLLDTRTDRLAELVGYYAPYPYFIGAIEGYRRHNLNWTAVTNGDFWLPYSDRRCSPLGYLFVTLGIGGAYLGVAGLVLAHTMHHFDRIVGRARDGTRRRSAPGGFPVGVAPAA